MRYSRRGVTLIELVVVVALLGIVAAIAGLTMHTARPHPLSNPANARIAAIRDSALASGHPITTTISSGDSIGFATAYPDGSVVSNIGDIDRTTGRPRAHP